MEAIFVEVSDSVIDNDFFYEGAFEYNLNQGDAKWQQLSK